uniref:Protein DPCD n=2 Tax=Arion vulgaris TaxID=1028688 RepID=A0A0B6ZF72_9EUPU
MADLWLQKLRSSHKTCLVQDGRRKIHFTMSDGMELAEEYDLKSGDLLLRKWKRKSTLGGVGKWEYEIGEQPTPLLNLDTEGLVESNTNPVFLRKDTKSHYQWRIRNLPYPISNYIIKKSDDGQIILSTVNKKYYKKFSIPDLERCALKLEEDKLELAHANNTLIISYKKPQSILEMEKTFEQEIKKMKANEDGEMDCTPS